MQMKFNTLEYNQPRRPSLSQGRAVNRGQSLTRATFRLITLISPNTSAMRDPKTGKFERVAKDATDPKVAEAQIDAALAFGNSFWIYTKDPSVQAFMDLMNRALDKPTEQVQLQEQGTIQIRWKDSTDDDSA